MKKIFRIFVSLEMIIAYRAAGYQVVKRQCEDRIILSGVEMIKFRINKFIHFFPSLIATVNVLWVVV